MDLDLSLVNVEKVLTWGLLSPKLIQEQWLSGPQIPPPPLPQLLKVVP